MTPDRPLNVVIVSPWLSPQGGGVSEAVRCQVRALHDQPGITLSVLTITDKHDRTADMDEGVKSVAFFGTPRFRFAPALLWQLWRKRPDLVHVHGLWMFPVLAVHVWSLITGRPYVVSPHGMLEPWILKRSPRLKTLVSKLYQDRFLKRAAGFQALSEREGVQIRDRGAIAPRPVIANPIEPPSDPGPRTSDTQRFVFLGRIHDKKGWRELLAGWDRACTQSIDFAANSELVLCGWVDGQSDFAAQCAALARSRSNLHVVGPKFGAEKWALLASSKFLVLPSRSEGVPMSVLEAWSVGTPALISKACNLENGFAQGAALDCGTDPRAIADALIRAGSLPHAQYRIMSEAARTLIAREFAPPIVARKLRALYADAAGHRP